MNECAGMNKEREIAFYEYIADAMRFASKEIGHSIDFSKYIILLPRYTTHGRERILGNKVYLVDSLPGDFDIACPYDCTSDDEEALEKIREYREMYTLPEQKERSES